MSINVLLQSGGEVDDFIDQCLEPVVYTIESGNFPTLFALEEQLRGMVSPDAWEVYQQLDLLVAAEKARIQRACYSVGVSHAMSQIILFGLAPETAEAEGALPIA